MTLLKRPWKSPSWVPSRLEVKTCDQTNKGSPLHPKTPLSSLPGHLITPFASKLPTYPLRILRVISYEHKWVILF